MNPMNEVRDLCFIQAKHFLEESGEFYPFGAIMLEDSEIKPLSASTGEEYPDSNILIQLLKKDISSRLNNGDIIAGGIGVDVFIKSSKDSSQISAIEVKVINKDGKSFAWYLPYIVQGKNIFYQDIIEEECNF